MALIKRFKDTQFILNVYTNGFELFYLKPDAAHCGDYDYENPLEHWEPVVEEVEVNE